MKTCPRCKEEKSLTGFYVRRAGGFQSWCISCTKRYAREKASLDPVAEADRVRWLHILKKYGLTKEVWLAIFEGQGRACGLCGSSDPGTPSGWHTDHNHKTGEVRGILCHSCNVRLGSYENLIEKVGADVIEKYLSARH